MQLHPEWNQEDRHFAVSFFSTPTGQRLIETLWINRPQLPVTDVEKTAMVAQRQAGWEEATNAIAAIIRAELTKEGIEQFRQYDTSTLRGRVINDVTRAPRAVNTK